MKPKIKRKEVVNICIEPELLEEIDKIVLVSKNVSRSKLVELLLKLGLASFKQSEIGNGVV